MDCTHKCVARGPCGPKFRNQLASRASTLGIPLSVWKPVVDEFIHLCTHSGEEWTVKRFKSLLTDFTQWLATGHRLPVPWVKSSSNLKFRYSGSIGRLERWCAKSDDRKIKALQLLKIYTFLISTSVTEAQREKFVSAVQANPKDHSWSFGTSDKFMRNKLVMDYRYAIIRAMSNYDGLPRLFGASGSATKSGPIPGGSVPEPLSFVDSARFLSDFSDGFHLYAKYKEIFSEVLGDHLDHQVRSTFGMDLKEHGFHVGRIGLIQEPGYKLRAVANPGRVFQFALHKVGQALYRALRVLPWDCTFEQDKAYSFIQSRLSSNQKAFCVDLRNATDYFPLKLQEELVSGFQMKPEHRKHFELWRDISKAPWKMGDSTIQWNVGQPLGLFPSFAAFAATHGFLLFKLNGMEWNQDFFILGDDVVILNETLYHKYVEVLEYIGCPTSPEKTLSSSKVAEFAGKIITCDDVTPILKWRDISDDNFIDIARMLGQKSLSILRPRQRRVVEKIMSWPTVGLGWNPHGVPIDVRIKEENEFLQLTSDVMPELQTDRMREAWRDVFHSSNFKYIRDNFGKGFLSNVNVEQDLEQRSYDHVVKHLGAEFSQFYQMFVTSASKLSGHTAGLPGRGEGINTGRCSTLLLMEKKLTQLDES